MFGGTLCWAREVAAVLDASRLVMAGTLAPSGRWRRRYSGAPLRGRIERVEQRCLRIGERKRQLFQAQTASLYMIVHLEASCGGGCGSWRVVCGARYLGDHPAHAFDANQIARGGI